MPYVFTSWTAYTDPASNARTLAWDRADLLGQPAGIHLECLRQAAVRRHAVIPVPDCTDPGELSTGIAAFGPLAALIDFLDAVAWYTGPFTWIEQTPIWLSRSSYGDLSAYSDSSGRVGDIAYLAESRLLTAIGASSREAKPNPVLGHIPVDWLLQIKALLQAKTLAYSGHLDRELGNGNVVRIREGDKDDWASLSWVDTAGSAYTHPGFNYSWISDIAKRVAATLILRAANSVACSDCDLYLNAGQPVSGTFYDPDYSFVQPGQWMLAHAAEDLSAGPLEEWWGDIDTLPTVHSCKEGYDITGYVAVCEYSADWALGA